jgi:hypothetical protein
LNIEKIMMNKVSSQRILASEKTDTGTEKGTQDFNFDNYLTKLQSIQEDRKNRKDIQEFIHDLKTLNLTEEQKFQAVVVYMKRDMTPIIWKINLLPFPTHSDYIFKIIQLCAQKNGEVTTEHFDNFCSLLKPEHVFEILKLCAQQDGEGTAKNFESIRLTFGFSNPEIVEIATLCAKKSGGGTAKYFGNFDITDPDHVFEIAMHCVEQNGEGATQHIREFNITCPDHALKIATICAQKNGAETAENFRQFGITNPEHVFEIATICAQQNGAGTAEHFRQFGITNPEHAFEIAAICARQDGAAVAKYFKQFGIDYRDNPKLVVEIATICARLKGGGTAQYFNEFGITDSDQAFEIAKFCARQSGEGTAEHFQNFGITNSEHAFEIAKFCVQQDATATADHFDKFGLENQHDMTLTMGRLCAIHGDFSDDAELLAPFLCLDSPLTLQEKLDILLLCKCAAELRMPDSYCDMWGQFPDLLAATKDGVDPSMLGMINLCCKLFASPKMTPSDGVALLRDMVSQLGCCASQKDPELQKQADANKAMFEKMLDDIAGYAGQDDAADPARHIQLQCWWMANLLMHLTLGSVSVEAVHALQPAIWGIFDHGGRRQRLLLNPFLCEGSQMPPESWVNRFATKSGAAENNLALATLLLWKLDPTDAAGLQARMHASADAKDIVTVSRLISACCALLAKVDLSSAQKLTLLKRIGQAAEQRTTEELQTRKDQYRSGKLQQTSLQKYWQSTSLENLQKALCNQIFRQCAKELLAKHAPKTIQGKLSGWIAELTRDAAPLSLVNLAALFPHGEDNLTDETILDKLQNLLSNALQKKINEQDSSISPDVVSRKCKSLLEQWRGKALNINKGAKEQHFEDSIDVERDVIHVHEIIWECALFQVILELGGTDAALQFMQADSSSRAFLRAKLQDLVGLPASFDVVRFLEVVQSWHNPYALLTYAGRLSGYNNALEGVRRFMQSLSNGTFIQLRYEEEIAKDQVFMQLPETFRTKWRDNTLWEQPLSQVLTKTDKATSPADTLHQRCLLNMHENICAHGHLGIEGQNLKKHYPLLAEYFEFAEKYPQETENLSPGSNVKALIEQAEPDGNAEEAVRQRYQFEKALIQFIAQPNQVKLDALKTALKQFPIDCELKNDLKSWGQTLQEGQGDKKFAGWKIVLSDDPELLMEMGNVGGSCQRYDGDPSLNQGLIGTILDPKVRLLAIMDDKGRVVGRCLVRITLNSTGKKILLVEKQYPDVLTPSILEEALKQHVIACAKGLGCSLVTTRESPKQEALAELLILGTRQYPAYLDSLKGNEQGDNNLHKIRAWFLYKDQDSLLPYV